jgi:hypothetical protein
MKDKNWLFILLLSVLFSNSIQAETQDEPGIVSRRYSYASLSAYQRQMLDDFIEDDFPRGSKISDALTDDTSLRNKTRLAQALLFRNKNTDSQDAVAVIRWLLKYQYQDEGSKNYGMWRTTVVGDRLDQNWREFIGCDLIIIYERYKSQLPSDVVKDIETGLIHAAKGAMKRNVSPDYTNISMMSSFMMDYVGTKFKLDDVRQAGLRKASDIFKLYNRYKTFSEYNSPTYYGVTLIAIALWREMAVSKALREMGSTLEKEFWKEAASFYNPNLLNMPGPYLRGYGMDMRKYYSIMGMWIAVALDNRQLAPVPFGKGPKFGEASNISAIYHVGLVIPKTVLAQLTRFEGPRFITRTIANYYKGDSVKHVSAMITKDWMMGGLSGNRRAWNQIRTGTIHWKISDSDIGWLLVPGDGIANVKVTKTTMGIYLADKNARTIQLFVYAKNAETTSFTDSPWGLPSLTLRIKSGLKQNRIEKVERADFENTQAIADNNPYVIRVVYDIPASWNPADPLIEISPEK